MKIPFYLLTQTSLAVHLREVILLIPTRGVKITTAQIMLTSLGNAISGRLSGRDISKFSVRSAPTPRLDRVGLHISPLHPTIGSWTARG